MESPNHPSTVSKKRILIPLTNDDQLQCTHHSAATTRRISRAVNSQCPPSGSEPCFNRKHILKLFQRCIKLASENKINQKNAWDFDLIDHLTYIIWDEEINFQMASCILEAGVKIYSLRVDSVYSETYKVLAGMNRAGQEIEQESVNAEEGQAESKKGIVKKLSPLSTLESSFEALNVKKLDAALTVDPLFRQTSAKFNEGGAKGLLMNNLGVYSGCRMLFDSQEVPGKYVASENEHDISDIIDLSFARDCIEQMVLDMQIKDEISPTLRLIVNLFDENNRRPSDFQCFGNKSAEVVDAAIDCEVEAETVEYEHDNQTFVAEVGSNNAEPNFSSYPQEKEIFPSKDPDIDELFGNVDEYISFNLGFRSKKNAWAGPDHWKYHKAKGSESEVRCSPEDGSALKTRPPKTMRQIEEVDLDFTNSLGKTSPDIFAPPKNHKSLSLPENRPHCVTKLPEDCRYEPEDLVKLFLLPNLKCLGRRARKFSDESTEQCNNNEPFNSWDNRGVFDGEYDGALNDTDESSTLISQPRQINKDEVQYDKTSKQVDVQELKLALWNSIQESVQHPFQGEKEMVSFKDILANFPSKCNAAATVTDISPHLCFICLLHLANEKELSLQSFPNMDDIHIYKPS